MHDVKESKQLNGSSGIEFKFGNWSRFTAVTVEFSNDQMSIRSDDDDRREFITFSHWRGSNLRKLMRTWCGLSLGYSIPIDNRDITWRLDDDNAKVIEVTPGWPSDFTVVLRVVKDTSFEALNRWLPLPAPTQ